MTVHIVGDFEEKKFRTVDVRPNVSSPSHMELLRLKAGLNDTYLPGVEALGAGYDIFGDYASAKSISFQLFDWSKDTTKPVSFEQQYVIPTLADAQQLDQAIYHNIAGETIEKYQENLSISVAVSGAYNLYSGSVKNDFSSSSTREAENEFTRIQQSITKWSLALRPNYSALRALLNAGVKTAIDNASTDAEYTNLFSKYGSHFITGLTMGGRATFSSSTDKVHTDKTYSNETVAEASYQGLTGQITASAAAKYALSMQIFTAVSQSHHTVTGGDGVAASRIFSGNKADFDAWVATIGSSPDFIDFSGDGSLTGIWELCETQQKRDAMESYFLNTWAPAESAKHQILANYIDEIIIIYGGNSSISPPAGYVKVDVDLNKGARGKYIYLCYHKSSASPTDLAANPNGLTDITAVQGGKDVAAPAGFEKIDIDLNKGAGHDYIYLCYKKDAYANDQMIKDITVITGGSGDIPPPYGYYKVPQDLNASVGGDHVFACYSKNV